MTVAEAMSAIRRVGTVETHAGNLRLRYPETAASELQPAIDTLRTGKAEALALLRDLEALAFPRHEVVVADHALVDEAADACAQAASACSRKGFVRRLT